MRTPERLPRKCGLILTIGEGGDMEGGPNGSERRPQALVVAMPRYAVTRLTFLASLVLALVVGGGAGVSHLAGPSAPSTNVGWGVSIVGRDTDSRPCWFQRRHAH